jgi:hypothetical protein
MKFSLIWTLIFFAFSTFAQQEDASVVSHGGAIQLKEADMSAYLMVYFTDETHSVHIAVSVDGYTFTDINDGQPIIAGDTIADQRGIRDPHIFRGPDNMFYLVMTDLHIYAQREGRRTTEWDRDAKEFGWGNNRGIILMKSKDLLHWQRTNIRMDVLFPEWKDVGCVWAPQTIYDEEKEKLMLYFSMRRGTDTERLYYVYVNSDFDRIESAPRLLFSYPKDITYIDGDISRIGDKHHLFYVSHDGTPGIKQAVSNLGADRGYTYDPIWYDPEPTACEAPNVWKRIGEDKWVLMYDVYGVVPHNFGFSETVDFKTFHNLGHFNKGVMKASNFVSPKHGAVIHITASELAGLQEYWHFDLTDVLTDEKRVDLDSKSLGFVQAYRTGTHWDLPLAFEGPFGSRIEWKSDNPAVISDEGHLLARSPEGQNPIQVKMTAILSYGKSATSHSFDIKVAPEEPKYAGYLFAYFEGSGESRQQEQLRFAVSRDAQHWYALNDNQPVLASSEVSGTGGIRDPHILRGEDQKSFYMVATDMFTKKNDWNSNPGIVLMKSHNLVDWTHAFIHLEKSYPDHFNGVKWIWAPQTIYDPMAGRYLVYFTVRFEDDDKLDFYAAYANRDFTAFETIPTLLFRAKHGAIDGDIIYRNGLYHFFYKGNTKNEEGVEIKNGIQQAIGKQLWGPWEEIFSYIDTYADRGVSVEGSSIFKLNQSDEYILMYDLYRAQRYELQRSSA